MPTLTAPSSSKRYTYTFPGGFEMTGTIDQLETQARLNFHILNYVKLGVCPRGSYNSATKGVVKISSMHSYHIKQAISKRMKYYMTEHCNRETPSKTYTKNFFAIGEDTMLADLLTELAKRND